MHIIIIIIIIIIYDLLLRGRDGGTNFILRIKEQQTRLTLQEHDDDVHDAPILI